MTWEYQWKLGSDGHGNLSSRKPKISRKDFISLPSECSETHQSFLLWFPFVKGWFCKESLPRHDFDMLIAYILTAEGNWKEKWIWRRVKHFSDNYELWLSNPIQQPYTTKSYSLISDLYHWVFLGIT